MFRIHNRRLFWRLAGRSIKANLGRHLLTALAVFLSTLMLFSIFTIGVNYFRNLQVMMDRLDFLLDSMVKLSRLETGSIRLQAAPVDVEELILNAALQVRKAAEEKAIDLAIQPLDHPVQVLCDKKWTEEAVFNILDNAVKYTPNEGRVALTVEAYETYCRIDVADTGCGIPPDEVTKVFQRFYRGKAAQTVDGAGLGLPLARKIIQEQGGWIKITSQERGCIFSILLRRVSDL